MEETVIPVESIRERDVDLILLEELSVDFVFCEWITRELGLPIFENLFGAWRSMSAYGLGETDILFSYESENKKIYVLIENKLDASFQDEQYQRYMLRAEKYIQNNQCDKAYSVLIAPKIYCENQTYFERYMTYEEISSRFEKLSSKRNLFKSQLFKIASEKLRRGYQPINSEIVQKFWSSYWEYKNENYPNLKMKKPGIVPLNSDWPMLYDDNLKGVVFYHKWYRGTTDATFKSFTDSVKYKIQEILPEEFELIEHRKNFSVRLLSDKVDRKEDFQGQLDKIKSGLDNLEKLRVWLTENPPNK